MSSTFGMFVKYPEPGRVKTRLATTIGETAAAELYRAFLLDLVDRFRTAGHRRVLAYSPDNETTRVFFTELAAGAYELWPQPQGELGARMRAFFEHFGPFPTVLIGSDSPTLSKLYPEAAFRMLETTDVVLGPATDGGLYLIGLNQQRRTWPIFDEIDWSTSKVLDQIMQRLAREQAQIEVLPPWYDVDEPTDLDFLRGHLSALRFAKSAGGTEAPATCSALNRLSGLDVMSEER